MAWALLFLAGALEVAWPIGFKYSAGFTRLVPTVIFIFVGVVGLKLVAKE